MYKSAVFVLFLAALVITLRILLGNPPDYVSSPFLSGVLFSVSTVVSLVSLWAFGRLKTRGYYLFACPVLVFLVAGYFSGLPQKAIWILSASCVLMLAIVVLFGDKADQNTPDRTIRIKLPW